MFVLENIILKSIIEGVHLAVYSSIKPGSIHRLRLDSEAQVIVSNTLSVIDYIIEAINYGEKIRRGDIALTSIEIGKLIAKALRESYRWNSGRVYPQLIIPQLIYSIALSHSNVDSFLEGSGKVRESLKAILSINRWSEIREIINVLNSSGRRDMYEHLEATGITRLANIGSSVSLSELFRVLSSRWIGFSTLDIVEYNIPVYVKKLIDYYRTYKDTTSSVIALYLDFIRDKSPNWVREYIDQSLKYKLMTTREGAKILFELDNRMRRENIIYDEYVHLLALVIALGVFDGLRP